VFKKEPARISNVEALKPIFREAFMQILEGMRNKGWDPRVFETLRMLERQAYLYSIGRRGKRGERPVTWTMNSKHIKGIAGDVISKKDGWSNKKFFDDLALVAAEHGCRTLPGDRCHVELE